jgi:hypothetical protein
MKNFIINQRFIVGQFVGLVGIAFSSHSRKPSLACSEAKIWFTLLVNLSDFRKPFKGNTHQSFIGSNNILSLFLGF